MKVTSCRRCTACEPGSFVTVSAAASLAPAATHACAETVVSVSFTSPTVADTTAVFVVVAGWVVKLFIWPVVVPLALVAETS